MRVKIGSYPKHRWYHNWLYDKFGYVNDQKMSIQIDNFDTWSMDHTLSYIIEPMLKQLKLTKHGSPSVDDKDVPAEIRSTVSPSNGDDTDGHWHERWDYVLNEMIFAFESKHNDWEKQFQSGAHDVQWIEHTEGEHNGMHEMIKGPNDTFKIDTKGQKAYQKRISNGFRLFGKYYESLWD